MAGINPNLGNNLKLQNLQLSKTVNVDTQNNKGKEVDDAKPAAVFIRNLTGSGPAYNKDVDLVLGDVLITIEGDKVYYERCVMDARGEWCFIPISADDVQDRDYETDRGDIRC